MSDLDSRMKGVPLWLVCIAVLCGAVPGSPGARPHQAIARVVQDVELQKRLARHWNSWDSRNVLAQVLLPEAVSFAIGFKQFTWIGDEFLSRALIGRRGQGVEEVRPGLHAFDGRYSQIELSWRSVHAGVETAHDGDDVVVLVSPRERPNPRVSLVVQAGMLWNRPGTLSREHDSLVAQSAARTVRIFVTGPTVEDPYVPVTTPYLVVDLTGPVAVSTGRRRTLDEVRAIIEREKSALEAEAGRHGDLSEAYLAIQAGIAWNTIYEPKHNRVVSTVGRLWNEEYGGYCLFGWDNFLLAYMTALYDRDLAFANVLEHLRSATEEGFIPNDDRGNGTKSWDHSQPPVGALVVREIYKRYPEPWLLEATFDSLLRWNRWWIEARLNEGLLSYGSHAAQNPFGQKNVHTGTTARYESGMDDSPMYAGVPFNPKKNVLELQDIGLNSLYVADCDALAEMAALLGRQIERSELLARSADIRTRIAALWDPDTELYLNRRTDTGELSHRLSPTHFFPLLARIPDQARAERIRDRHFLNPLEFYGTFMLPSIARNDPDYPKQRYWKGAVWPPLNLLVYLGLRNYGMKAAAADLAARSREMFLAEWRRKGFVCENYSALTGAGDDERLSSDQFHSWGSLMGFLSFIEAGEMPAPERPIDGRER